MEKVSNAVWKICGHSVIIRERVCMNLYEVKVYWKDEQLVCRITVDKGVKFTNYTDDTLKLPFGVRTEVGEKDLQEFYRERAFPEERDNCKEVLNALGLNYYDAESVCRKTHGLQFDDFLWLQFSDEPQVKYSDIKLR